MEAPLHTQACRKLQVRLRTLCLLAVLLSLHYILQACFLYCFQVQGYMEANHVTSQRQRSEGTLQEDTYSRLSL